MEEFECEKRKHLMPYKRRTHHMVIKNEESDSGNQSLINGKTDCDEACYSNDYCSPSGNEEDVHGFFANQILGDISKLLSANPSCRNGGSKRASRNDAESDENMHYFDHIFDEYKDKKSQDDESDEPKAKKVKDSNGIARTPEDWQNKECGNFLTIPMPMCVRLVEVYRKCRAHLRTFSQRKEDRKARHQMWDAIDAHLTKEFGIQSGVNRLKKKIQNIQAGARGKIEALRREAGNGVVSPDTNIRFTAAEMEMVRMLYQTGDVILNTVTSNKEPFYFQLEGLMRESGEKKVVLDTVHAEKLPATSSTIKEQVVAVSQTPQTTSRKTGTALVKETPLLLNSDCTPEQRAASLISLFGRSVNGTGSSIKRLVDTDYNVSTNNHINGNSNPGGQEATLLNELFLRQITLLKRQEAMQTRAELLLEKQFATESKLDNTVTALTKVVGHLEQTANLLLNACHLATLTGQNSGTT